MSDLAIPVPQVAELGTHRLMIVTTAAGTSAAYHRCPEPGALSFSPLKFSSTTARGINLCDSRGKKLPESGMVKDLGRTVLRAQVPRQRQARMMGVTGPEARRCHRFPNRNMPVIVSV